MLEAIKEAIFGIYDFFKSIVDFVLALIEDLVYMVKLVGEVVLKIPDYLSFLPGEIVALFLTILAVVVIYKILGREG